MTLTTVIRAVYGLLAIIYLLIGTGSMLLPAGWLPDGVSERVWVEEIPSPYWVGPDGFHGSWARGIFNSVPFLVMLLLGLAQLRASEEARS